jgi:hypothetical protein
VRIVPPRDRRIFRLSVSSGNRSHRNAYGAEKRNTAGCSGRARISADLFTNAPGIAIPGRFKRSAIHAAINGPRVMLPVKFVQTIYLYALTTPRCCPILQVSSYCSPGPPMPRSEGCLPSLRRSNGVADAKKGQTWSVRCAVHRIFAKARAPTRGWCFPYPCSWCGCGVTTAERGSFTSAYFLAVRFPMPPDSAKRRRKRRTSSRGSRIQRWSLSRATKACTCRSKPGRASSGVA